MPAQIIEVANLKQTVEDFILATIQRNYGSTDLSESSVIRELMVSPVASLAPIVVSIADIVERRSMLSNYANLPEEEIDDLGTGNYFISRDQGEKSYGTVIVSYSSVSTTENTVISAGIKCLSRGGLVFESKDNYSYTPAECAAYYNTTERTYDFPIILYAESVGAAYNITPGEISGFAESSYIPDKVSSCRNESPFKGGTDKENVSEYIAKITNFYSSRDLEKGAGYKRDIMDGRPEVKDVNVQGKGDPYMTRDVASSITFNGVTLTNVHIGGMVDAYILGKKVETVKISHIAKTNHLPLSTLIADINPGVSLVVKNVRTNVTLTHTTFDDVENKTRVVVVPKGSQWINGDTIEVSYEKAGEGGFVPQKDSFTLSISNYELISPVENVSLVRNEKRKIEYPIVNDAAQNIFTITFDDNDLRKTSRDSGHITTINEFAQSTTLPRNGEEIGIYYTYNETIKSLGYQYDIDEDRVVTRDILFKPATPAHIHVWLEVKLKKDILPSTLHSAAIQSTVSASIDKILLNGQLEASDLISALYQDSTTGGYIEYVKQNLKTFHRAANENESLVPINDGDRIKFDGITYPTLSKFKVDFIVE